MRYQTFAEARRALARGGTSCEALVSSFFERIEAENDRLNVFITLRKAGALVRARDVDARRARGDTLPLDGLVLAVKDVICRKDERVTCGSRMLEHFTSLIDATALRRLEDAGAVVVGKTNCDEFAMGSSNETSYFGPTRHPLQPDYVPGGSSGGSATAVAAGFCHAALGTDTGGSIRQPAAFCGTVGLKPTYGRVSRYGLVAFASSFDVIGPFARSVEDVALLLTVMAGRDPLDATSAPVPVDDYPAALTGSVEGLRIGLPREYFADGLDPDIRQVLDVQVASLEKAGARFKDVSLPHTDYGIATYYILTMAEASSNLSRYDGVRYGYRPDPETLRQRVAEAANGSSDAGQGLLQQLYVEARTAGFGEEVKRRIMLGTYVLSAGYYDAYYGKAQRIRTLVRRDFDRAFEDVDVLLTPAAPTLPFRLGSKVDDPLAMYLGDVYTVSANLAGIPGLVVPVGTSPGGFPIGMQLLGRPFDEGRLLQVGDVSMNLAGTAP